MPIIPKHFTSIAKRFFQHTLPLLGVLLLGLSGGAQAQGNTFDVSELRFHQHRLVKDLCGKAREEIRQLSDRPVKFDSQAVHSQEEMKQALKSAATDPETDLVLACGDLAARKALQEGKGVDTPVLGLGFLPLQDSYAENNLIPVSPQQNIWIRDLDKLGQISGRERVHILAERKLLQEYPHLEDALYRAGEEAGMSPALVEVDKEGIHDTPEEAEAVYLLPLQMVKEPKWKELIEELSSRQALTFSYLGHPEVRKGALAGYSPDLMQRLAKRAAMVVAQMQHDEALGMDARLETYPGRLLINAATARTAGYRPGVEIGLQTEFVNWDKVEAPEERRLELDQAIARAMRDTPEVRIHRAEAEESRGERKTAGSAMLPQISGEFVHRRIAEDSSRISLGTEPERWTTAGVRIRQMIFSDPVITRYMSARERERAKELQSRAGEQDAGLKAGLRFLDCKRAREGLRIRRQNLDLTRENLRLAKIREQTGMAGPEEVHRLRMKLSEDKDAVLQAEAELERARVALNRSMSMDQERKWKTADVDSGEKDLYGLPRQWAPLVLSPRMPAQELKQAVETSISRAPEVEAAGKAMEAAELQLQQKRRSRYMIPEVGVEYRYDHVLDVNRMLPEINDFPDEAQEIGNQVIQGLEEEEDHHWSLALRMEFPLFQGGSEIHEVRSQRARLARLSAERERARQGVEQRLRSAVHSMRSSYRGMEYSRDSARYADKHLQEVQNKYARGDVSLIELLDAQTRRENLKRQAAMAVVDYLEDTLRFQRALSSLGQDSREISVEGEPEP